MKRSFKKVSVFFVALCMMFNSLTIFAGSEKWESKAPMSVARHALSAAAIDGKIYAIGGHDGNNTSVVEEYDPTTNSWTTKTPMTVARHGLGVAAVNGKIYAIGGANGPATNIVEAYEPSTDSWTTKTPMPVANTRFGIAELDGKIYLAGGSSQPNALVVYDPATDTWTSKTNMPTSRSNLALAAVNGKLYAVGGSGGANTLEEYNPTTNTWTTKADMPTLRNDLSAIGMDGKLYVIGGWNNSIESNIIEEYDPATDSWATVQPLQQARHAFGIAAISGSIYVMGGYSGGNINTVEALSGFSTSTPTQDASITFSTPKDTVKLNEEFTTDVILNNATGILAEDVKITYDTSLFEFIGYEEVEGIKIYHQTHDASSGSIRTIVASQGNDYAINSDTTMFKLKFKAIAKGEGLVDSTAGRIANVETEWDLEAIDCDQISIKVEGYLDVNRTGAFTLVDLAIDAFYFDNFANVDTSKYDADIVIDNAIDDLDLTAIVGEILDNSDYAPNN